jgi:hypothetical protein
MKILNLISYYISLILTLKFYLIYFNLLTTLKIYLVITFI